MIQLTAYVDCPECGTTFDGVWTDDSIDIQQIVETPVATFTCPGCGASFEAPYPGWMSWSEA
jgi:uncharacterized protein (UPF0212 family)